MMKELLPWDRWLVLAAFSFTSAIDAFLCMNFSAVSAVAKDVLGTDDVGLNFTYSIVLLTVLPVAIPVVMCIEHNFHRLSLMSVVANVIAGWLRYFAVANSSYFLAVLSSVFVGLGAAVVINSFALIGAYYFPPSQRAMAVSLAVQSNYAGWGLGALVMPNVVSTGDDLERAMLIQAFVISSSLVFFCIFFREPPSSSPSETAKNYTSLAAGDSDARATPLDGHAKLSPFESVKIMFTTRQPAMQMFVFSVMSGIGFSIPAIQDEVFTSRKFGDFALSSTQSSLTNVAFILAGVVVGVILPLAAQGGRRRGIALTITFWVGTFGLTGLAWLVAQIQGHGDAAAEGGWTSDSVYSYQLVLMVLSGGGVLGFTGLGLAAIVVAAHPVSHEYSAGSVEWWNQVVGAVST